MNLRYQASALQDRFVANLLKFKRDGFYLDIGSCHAVSCNNTYCFEELGWKGICIEKDSAHNESYAKRTCEYINGDALQLDYKKILADAPKVIDYLSLDIDERSTDVLALLPLDTYSFRVITIEHDYYIHSGRFRDKQREILKANNYVLLCADVLVPLSNDTKPDCSFEDWWIHDNVMEEQNIMLIGDSFSMKKYPKDIIKIFQ